MCKSLTDEPEWYSNLCPFLETSSRWMLFSFVSWCNFNLYFQNICLLCTAVTPLASSSSAGKPLPAGNFRPSSLTSQGLCLCSHGVVGSTCVSVFEKKCVRKGFWEKKNHTMFSVFYVWVLIVRTPSPHFTLTLWPKFSEIIILSLTILWTTIPVLRSIIFFHTKFSFSIDFSKIQQHPFQQLQYQAPKQ